MLIGILIGAVCCLGLTLTMGTSCRSCRGFDIEALLPVLIACAVIILVVLFFRWLDKK